MQIRIQVKPMAKTSDLELRDDGTWLAHVKSQPSDGKANQELIELVARHWRIRKADVSIKSGGSGRIKTLRLNLVA